MITSPTNARIKSARKLQRRRNRDKEQQILIEGVRLVEDAWRAGVRPVQVFYDAERVADNVRASTLLGEMRAADVPCAPCTSAVFAVLADTVTTQGIAAVTPIPRHPPPAAVSLALVLDGIRDPGNAGTLLRTAEAAGADWALFAPGTVDAYNDKTLRAAMGAHFRLPLSQFDTWSALRAQLPASAAVYLADAAGDRAYTEVDWRKPAVLIVGGEAEGARAPARAVATPIMIPMHGGTESLNAAVAGSVILMEAARQRGGAR